MRNKHIKGYATILIVLLMILPFNLIASASKLDKNSIDTIYSSDIIGDKMPDEAIEILRDEGLETNPLIKEPISSPYKEYEIAKVDGGNMEAINPLATKQHIAKADVVENVGEAGKEFEIFLDEGENGEGTVKQTRQFITFTTKSGKTLHLIIDHEKTSQNVSLLTEVGEQDLLNMIEGDKSSFNTKPVEIEKPKEEAKEEIPVDPKAQEKRKLSLPVIVVILIAVIGAGYYFKIYKPGQDDFEDEYDEDELEYEEAYEEEFDDE